jgi:hypothetical protein
LRRRRAVTLKGFLEDVAREAEKRGFKVEEGEGVVRATSSDLPIGVEVSVSGDTVTVRLYASENLEESIREFAEEEGVEDVREAVEEILETALAVVDYAVKAAEAAGYKVKRETRETVFDVYEAIDTYEEER